MSDVRLESRIAEANAAARLLGDAPGVLTLAVAAFAEACPRGLVLGFMQRADGSVGPVAAMRELSPLQRPGNPPATPIPWVVDIKAVPASQQNRWIEPLRIGIHAADYFLKVNPLPMQLMQTHRAPDYGRIMFCHNGRMIAWLGLYLDGRNGFRDSERSAIALTAAKLATPLRAAALLADVPLPPAVLAPRQSEILARVARGWTNKRIAADLGIAPATVKTVLERLFLLSGAPNRAALVDWWQRGGRVLR